MIAVLLAPAWCACVGRSSGSPLALGPPAFAPPTLSKSAPASAARCLSGAPIDLSFESKTPPPSFYVNDLRLGYARGEAVFLSRPLCRLQGPLCRFVEAHEQAHHYMSTVGARSECAETLADCWAAVHSDEAAVAAAIEYFRGLQGSSGHHAPPAARARTIAECSRLSVVAALPRADVPPAN